MTTVITVPTVAARRRRSIRRHLTSAYARDRVRAALYEVVVDAVEFGPCSLQTRAGRDWLRAAVARPLEAGTEAALAALAGAFERAFDEAPLDVRAWLEAVPD